MDHRVGDRHAFTVLAEKNDGSGSATIRIVVSLRGKGVRGVRVQVRGAGMLKSGVTDARGRVRIAVRPARVGIVQIRITNRPGACAARRMGVVGVFKPPPVTG